MAFFNQGKITSISDLGTLLTLLLVYNRLQPFRSKPIWRQPRCQSRSASNLFSVLSWSSSKVFRSVIYPPFPGDIFSTQPGSQDRSSPLSSVPSFRGNSPLPSSLLLPPTPRRSKRVQETGRDSQAGSSSRGGVHRPTQHAP